MVSVEQGATHADGSRDERASWSSGATEPLGRVAALSRSLRTASGRSAVIATALVHISAALGPADVTITLCDKLFGATLGDLSQKDTATGQCQAETPLLASGTFLGLLHLSRASALSPDERRALAMAADLVAGALYRTLLEERLARSEAAMHDAYETSVDAWSRALEMRHRGGSGHSRRLASLAVAIGHELGMSASDLINLRRGALLHDIGTMGIPDAILQKEGPLTDGEWAVMRQHPLFAGELLAPIGFLEPALAAPRYHHERWDGSGYPFGLQGDAIPLAARIVAVADAWVAMISARPYRTALSSEQAITEIRAGAGAAYDPAVVEVFLRVVPATTAAAAD